MTEKMALSEEQLVVFYLADESYAISINMVKEIIPLQPVTRIPGTPLSVEGVINLRGSVVPIVDLRKRFQFKTIERKKENRIMVLACKGAEVGVIVDSVTEVIKIPAGSIEPASNVFMDEHLEHLLGIIKLPGRLLILLDMDQVLSQKEISAFNSLDAKKIIQSSTCAK